MTEYEIHPDFLQSRERVFFALAIADGLIHNPRNREIQALHNIFKLIATGERDGVEVTFSGKVDRLARSGDRRSQFFHPQWANRINWHENQLYSDEEAIAIFTNPPKTERAQTLARQWGEDTELHSVRTNLGITPDTEEPYEVYVLYKTTAEIDDELGGGARCSFEKGEASQMILPSDYVNYPNFFPHEYAHAQTREGLMRGLHGLLFREANEAITDELTGTPMSYEEQRGLIHHIASNQTEVMDDLVASYKGDQEAHLRMISTIANNYGAEAVLALARIDAAPNARFKNFVEESVYLSHDEVSIFFL